MAQTTPWTEEKTALLKRHWTPDQDRQELLKLLNMQSWDAVRRKAEREGLPKDRTPKALKAAHTNQRIRPTKAANEPLKHPNVLELERHMCRWPLERIKKVVNCFVEKKRSRGALSAPNTTNALSNPNQKIEAVARLSFKIARSVDPIISSWDSHSQRSDTSGRFSALASRFTNVER